MTKLLEEAIAQLKTRPISEQDSIAALILEELQDNDDLGSISEVLETSDRGKYITTQSIMGG